MLSSEKLHEAFKYIIKIIKVQALPITKSHLLDNRLLQEWHGWAASYFELEFSDHQREDGDSESIY